MIPVCITVTLMLPGYLMERPKDEPLPDEIRSIKPDLTESERGDGFSYLDDNRGSGRVWSIDRKCNVGDGDEQVDEHKRLTERLLTFEHLTELEPHVEPISFPWVWDNMCEDKIPDQIMQGIADDVLPMLQRSLDGVTGEWLTGLREKCRFWRFSFIALLEVQSGRDHETGAFEFDGFTYRGRGHVVQEKPPVKPRKSLLRAKGTIHV